MDFIELNFESIVDVKLLTRNQKNSLESYRNEGVIEESRFKKIYLMSNPLFFQRK